MCYYEKWRSQSDQRQTFRISNERARKLVFHAINESTDNSIISDVPNCLAYKVALPLAASRDRSDRESILSETWVSMRCRYR